MFLYKKDDHLVWLSKGAYCEWYDRKVDHALQLWSRIVGSLSSSTYKNDLTKCLLIKWNYTKLEINY